LLSEEYGAIVVSVGQAQKAKRVYNMVDIRKPRKGSLGFRPRKRARSQNVSVNWLDSGEQRVMGFAGYKVGMTHVMMSDQTESPTKGQEISCAATVIEVPPMMVYGVRYYDKIRSIGDVLVADEKILAQLNIKKKKTQKEINEEEIKDVRLLAFCTPGKTLTGKKHIESMEIGVGGADPKAKLEYAKSLLGKELKVSDVFKAGELVDAIAVTKGKGWQGAIKRFGCNKQRRKATGRVRHIGTLGAWIPNYVLYTVPQAGQTGYHTRTELNKQVLKIGGADNISEINPSSGFNNYGFVKNDYLLIKGSLPGPNKRLVKLRAASRGKDGKETQLTYISLESR
jgi:large subunit ribosomal protein L3